MDADPINRCVVIGYCRPQSLQKTLLAALKRFDKKHIHCFIDAPKSAKQKTLVDKSICVANEYLKKSHITVRNENFGLKKNILTSISEVAKITDCTWITVLEDDVFLKGLPRIKDLGNFDVVNLSSFSVVSKNILHKELNKSLFKDTYFVCWGWMIRRELWETYTEWQLNDLKRSIFIEYLKKVKHQLPIGVQLLNNRFNRSNTWAVDLSVYITIKDIKIATCYPSLATVMENQISENVHVSRSFEYNQNENLLFNQHKWLKSRYTKKSLFAEKIIRNIYNAISVYKKFI